MQEPLTRLDLLSECSQLLQSEGVEAQMRETLCVYLDRIADKEPDYYGRYRAAVCFLEDCDTIKPDASDKLLKAAETAFFGTVY